MAVKLTQSKRRKGNRKEKALDTHNALGYIYIYEKSFRMCICLIT